MDQGRDLRSVAGDWMTCKLCSDRRAGIKEALSQRDAIKAAEHAMKGLAEMVGLKKKEGDASRE